MTEITIPTFESLYQTYYTPIYQRVLRIVRNPHDAEDVTQETFLKVLEALPTFDSSRGSGSVVGWLYTIAVRTAIDATRRRQVRGSTCSLDALAYEPADRAHTDPQTRYTSTIEQAMTALQRLQPHYREVLLLQGAGYSLKELAAHFDKAERTIRAWLTEARQQCLSQETEACA
jgi:RNA polymerase sigma-70 factor (ECF subfamily)